MRLRQLFSAAIDATHGERLLTHRAELVGDTWRYEAAERSIEMLLPAAGSCGRVVVVGAGKAAASLALGLEKTLDARIDRGGVCVKHGHVEVLRHIRVFQGGHPWPDAAGIHGTQEILKLLHGVSEQDVIFVLLTGGASSLLVSPARGVTFSEKLEISRKLILSGASIGEINVVRKHLSAVKGGRLAERCGQARVCTLVVSDVLGDDPATIGSGPTVPDPSTYGDALQVLRQYGLAGTGPRSVVRHLERGAAGLERETPKPGEASGQARLIVVANIDDAVAAVAQSARSVGFVVVTPAMRLSGDTHAAARRFARLVRASAARRRDTSSPSIVMIAGGETTLEVCGTGSGGRNQEFAMVAATELSGQEGVTLLAAGTDGTDGPTDAAGAFVDGTTIERAHRQGLNSAAMLRNNDSYTYFKQLGDSYVSGPTGTNVMDLVLAIIK